MPTASQWRPSSAQNAAGSCRISHGRTPAIGPWPGPNVQVLNRSASLPAARGPADHPSHELGGMRPAIGHTWSAANWTSAESDAETSEFAASGAWAPG
jgi:hypothetical protein